MYFIINRLTPRAWGVNAGLDWVLFGVESPIACLAQNLRALRTKHGLTQERLAEKAGVKYKYLQAIEGGELPGLSFRTLEKLALALKVECWELIYSEQPKVKACKIGRG